MDQTVQQGKQFLAKLSGFVISLLLLSAIVCPAAADSLTEAKVKAAFLYNFTKFVNWPSGSSGSRVEPFTICSLGERPLDGIIDETMRGKSVDERPLRTRHVQTKQDRQGCQVLFIPAGQHVNAAELAHDATYFGVLTIADTQAGERVDRFDAVITFVLRDGKVRFVINCKAAERAGLTISSRLLTLAVQVEQ